MTIEAIKGIARFLYDPEEYKFDFAYLQTTDVNEFLSKLHKQKLFIQAWPHLEPYIEDEELRTKYAEAYNDRLQSIDTIARVGKELYRELDQLDVPVVMVKGLVQAQVLYGSIHGRNLADIDLLTTEENMLAVDRILKKQGYLQVNHHAGGVPLLYPYLKEPYSHETYPYGKPVGEEIVFVEVARFCHGFNAEDCSRMLDRAVPLELGEYTVKALSKEDMFVQNVGNVFWNCGISYAIKVDDIRLGDYLELMLMIRQFGYDGKEIVALLKKHGIERIAAIVFSNLQQVFPGEMWIGDVVENLDSAYLDRVPVSFLRYQLTQPDKARAVTLTNRKQDIYGLGNRCFQKLIEGKKEEIFRYREGTYIVNYGINYLTQREAAWQPEDGSQEGCQQEGYQQDDCGKDCGKDWLEVGLEIPSELLTQGSLLFTITLYNNNPVSSKEKTVINLWNKGNEMYQCVGTDRSEKSAYYVDEGVLIEPVQLENEVLRYRIPINGKECEMVPSDILAASLAISEKKVRKLYHEVLMNYQLTYGFVSDVPLFLMK